MLTTLKSRVRSVTESAIDRWTTFAQEMKQLDLPKSGDLVKLDRKGWQFARVSTVISCEEPGKLFEIIADDGRQYSIRPAVGSAAPWQLIRLI